MRVEIRVNGQCQVIQKKWNKECSLIQPANLINRINRIYCSWSSNRKFLKVTFIKTKKPTLGPYSNQLTNSKLIFGRFATSLLSLLQDPVQDYTLHFLWLFRLLWSVAVSQCLFFMTLIVLSTRKGQFSFQSQRRAMPKNVRTIARLPSSHTLAK